MQSTILERKNQGMLDVLKVALQWLRAFLNSYFFYAFEFLMAVFFVYFRIEVQGVLIFVALLSFLLLVCDDIVPTTLPFLLLCTFATNCYYSFDTFIAYAIYAPIIFACVVFHFVVYKKSCSIGVSFKGVFAVSLALILGGFGDYSWMEYAKGSYYVLGLGAGMMIAYALMKSEFSVKREYDVKERFSVIMILMALFCIIVMVLGKHYHEEYGYNYLGKYRPIFSSNNIATLLLFAMPFPLYLSKKHSIWAIFTPIVLGALFYSGSRGGIVMGCLEFVACTVYWIYSGDKKIRGGIVLIALLACIIVALLYKDAIIVKVCNLFEIEKLKEEGRVIMFFEAIENFKKRPLLGTGILDDSIAYGEYNAKGTMTWYHMMIPQIIGSMGLVGVVAYSYQIWGRVKLIFTKKNAWSLCLGISYLGILLMSQVNPGEFCPIPFELLTVLLFIFQEERFVKKPLWERTVK